MTEKTVIQSVHLFEKEGLFDVRLADGLIEQISPAAEKQSSENNKDYIYIDGKEGFLSPGFIDLHMHLEKAFTIGNRECPGLMDAIVSFKEYCVEKISPEDIEKRVDMMIHSLVCHGTTSIRTHVSVDDMLNTMAIETLLVAKEKYKDIIDIQIIAMLSSLEMSEASYQALDSLGSSDIEGYGGAPALCDDPKKVIDQLFELAVKHHKIVDIHADEQDAPNVVVTDYFADKIIESGLIGRCTGGHLCALSSVDEEKAQETMEKMKASKMHVVTLPSCNLYLMGRQDQGIIRRGTTRIRELYEAGINISLASDNVRDPFRPFGNADMLEEMLLTAQVAQMGTYTDLRKVFRMGTLNPAKALGYELYGTVVGAVADLVLIEAPSAEEAILSQSNCRYVFKKGRIVCENTRVTNPKW